MSYTGLKKKKKLYPYLWWFIRHLTHEILWEPSLGNKYTYELADSNPNAT